MDRAIKKDITKKYREMEKRFCAPASGKVSCYVCEQCGMTTKVREVDDGLAPMGIECPYCNANAICITEGDTAPNIPVTHEWYRPTLDELLAMAETRLFSVKFALGGGLLRRPCSKN